MLTKTEYVDRYGNKVVDYRLTRGDSFPQNLEIKTESFDLSLIDRILFKLGDYDYNWLLQKPFDYESQINKYTVLLTSDETEGLEDDETYRYQIKIFYTSGIEQTVMSGKFKITSFIPEEVKNG